jgi:murein DD-endopeptidase MepM/ murein hydrolase activator NlpD
MRLNALGPRRLLGQASLVALVCACNVIEELRVEPPTAYERYARSLTDAGLAGTALGRDWLLASDSAMHAPLKVQLPFREAGVYSRGEARAVAYEISLADGQLLTARLRAEGLPLQFFVDLFEQTGDTAKPFAHRATVDTTKNAGDWSEFALQYEARRTGDYVIRLQPELLREGRYDLTLMIGPSLAFPVEGGGNRSVQSFFGADRDAGRRRHHGIDIFAPRGTPVLAATDGFVRSIAPNELGGNVVWLTDARRRQTLYYAHLDRHHVSAGQEVRVGDTLGFVGNTGNARGTRPHLHFGIYRRGEGPVDPYPFVRIMTAEPPTLAADTSRLGASGRTIAATSVLRVSPEARGDTLRRVTRNTRLQVVGATGSWYRVQLADGMSGYLAARTVDANGQERPQEDD